MKNPAIRVILLPKDTNPHGTIFGGVILSLIDLAAAVEVHKHTRHTAVTVAMDAIKFTAPIHVGDLVSCYTSLVKKGRTSITVDVEVEVERGDRPGDFELCATTARVTFVTVDPQGNAIPHDKPLMIC